MSELDWHEVQAKAEARMQALADLHPEASARAELQAAGVARSTINALYPIDADFFLECISAYVDRGNRFVLLDTEERKKTDRLEFVAWSTYRGEESTSVHFWWNSPNEAAHERLVYKILETQGKPGEDVVQQYDVATSILGVLARTFQYVLHAEHSGDPARSANALVEIFPMVLPDLTPDL